MSDDNAASPYGDPDPPTPAHPTAGGKSLATYERPRYKSWRKKYRKLHAHFDVAYEENRTLFKENQRLDDVARRLREEIDGLLDICLDLNQNPSIPPELRFDISLKSPPSRVSTNDLHIPSTITPEEANSKIAEYTHHARNGSIPPLELVDLRAQIDAQLAKQGVEPLDSLEIGVSRPPGATRAEEDLSFMPFDQEMEYLQRMDNRLATNGALPTREIEQEKHYADLTPRELERKTELENPQSQHNWLRTNTKVTNADEGDADSVASHDPAATGGKGKRKGGAGKGSLAKQVGDRAVREAREGSTARSDDEDELATDAGGIGGGAGKKRIKDSDGTYRLKGAKSFAAKGKRKRSGEDMPGGGAGKKVKVEGGGGVMPGTPGGASDAI